ncbi:MAG: D-alanyl-D-alanine carboxypeptidase [Oscillatoria sp. SIO1A7]|nr:D-alanyl-D-alanine carboxypeptidase [Oscillatoria sp. SIO1A7]
MPKKQLLTALLSLTLLALVGGCSPNDPLANRSDTTDRNTSESSAQNQRSEVDFSVENAPAPTPSKPSQPLTAPPGNPEPKTNSQIQDYIKNIAVRGFAQNRQGVWIQSPDRLLANHQGTVPLPAASVTKVATTLAALKTFSPTHQFVTNIGITGLIENGVLKGDLIVQGGEDPLFVWEEAIALGNTLNQLGIKRVAGNLVIVGKFYMNFEFDPLASGTLLQQGMNSRIWPVEAETQYQTLPPDTPRPQVIFDNGVKVIPSAPVALQPLVRHNSKPLGELVKLMNMYSNNYMAQMLADSVGGANAVAQIAADAAGIPRSEIQLINGSGLGEANRISPRAACGMFLALDRVVTPYNMTLADVVAIVGQDLGVLKNRQALKLSVIKTGTLNNVSSLAGVIPNQKHGQVCLAIINSGRGATQFRDEQDALVTRLLSQWGTVSTPPAKLKPTSWQKGRTSGNEIVKKESN